MAQDGAVVRSIADLPPPVEGPSVWYGPEMAKRTDWVHTLSAERRGRDRAGRAAARGRARPTSRASRRRDFPLPTLAPKLARICDEAINGRGFVLMRGLPVERWSIRESATAYFGVGAHFGSARSQNAKGHVLGHVRDLGRNAAKDPTARIYQTAERQTYHTDSCDIVGLLCLKTAKSGGASALVSSMTIYNEMLKRRPDLLALPVRAAAHRSARRGAGGPEAVARHPRLQLVRGPPVGALRAPLHRVGAPLPRGAAADARADRGARPVRCAGRGPQASTCR